ncbi:abortive infection family protein [Polaromonas sp.]|uniref:abortive infection family protein n=1 Tax=Polaromonas sp. TaxID=1869339 RepID=UPI001818E821|nr:abortive infection family protein [Polaromonas sp.]NML86458.1 abortive infection family protein [Polaromonas sp.]
MPVALPLTDTVIAAVAQLIDDSKSNGEYRDPTHSDIDFYVSQAGLTASDPKRQGQTVGKAKRVRAVLHAALTDDAAAGSALIASILAKVRACGGFREGSPNFVGTEAIANVKNAFDTEGFLLASDGSISPKVLSALQGPELTAALRAYADRAQKGAHDAALLAGTGKDLLEATAAHVLQTVNGVYPSGANFHSLLGMAFIALDLAVPELPAQAGEAPVKGLERGLFQAAIAVNRLRNKEGTGHGRPWLPTLKDDEAKASIELVGSVSSYLLSKLARHRK